MNKTHEAIAWAIQRFGTPDLTTFINPVARAHIDAAVTAGAPLARKSPVQQLLADVGSDRDALAALRRQAAVHQRGALDRAISGRTSAPLDHAIIGLFRDRAPSVAAEPLLPRIDLRSVGLKACGVALASTEGRALARALLGLDDDGRARVHHGRQLPLAEGPAGVVRDAFVRVSQSTAEPMKRAESLALYLLAFVHADAPTPHHTAFAETLEPSQRAKFHDFLRTAARSSRREHAPALATLFTDGGEDV